MPDLPESAQTAAAIAVETSLEDYLGYGLNAESCDDVVRCVLLALGDEGLILVRRDDLDIALNPNSGADLIREEEAMTGLRAALSEKNEDANA